MNAQQKMLEYAKSKMNEGSTLTPEQWCGKMIKEGIVISRDGDMVVAHAKREGKTIIITETTKGEKHEVVDGRLVSAPVETVAEVMRLSL